MSDDLFRFKATKRGLWRWYLWSETLAKHVAQSCTGFKTAEIAQTSVEEDVVKPILKATSMAKFLRVKFGRSTPNVEDTV